uniref:Uncharacterized protein n=1 Tax=Chromera velia CCMP2878 TaxID=1169474 RepID=A0A0G4HD21_9ALVE|eukprot:Cvel_26159.t1-p1 / transcript=Cvel_26159.t1 / gene=Cvel_26159 / organism=Chromera_velia_CCMP2878 / gene_product=hypothetical protein / transcript_product=hypothetical protein / location=Cvel_scaffold3070:3479-4672(-) / protein_length=260 / sequence_SO=supercontig / SO=protein_coding / is_pseudo=false
MSSQDELRRDSLHTEGASTPPLRLLGPDDQKGKTDPLRTQTTAYREDSCSSQSVQSSRKRSLLDEDEDEKEEDQNRKIKEASKAPHTQTALPMDRIPEFPSVTSPTLRELFSCDGGGQALSPVSLPCMQHSKVIPEDKASSAPGEVFAPLSVKGNGKRNRMDRGILLAAVRGEGEIAPCSSPLSPSSFSLPSPPPTSPGWVLPPVDEELQRALRVQVRVGLLRRRAGWGRVSENRRQRKAERGHCRTRPPCWMREEIWKS